MVCKRSQGPQICAGVPDRYSLPMRAGTTVQRCGPCERLQLGGNAPVDMASVAYLFEHTDLTLGLNSKMPLGAFPFCRKSSSLLKACSTGHRRPELHEYFSRPVDQIAENYVPSAAEELAA